MLDSNSSAGKYSEASFDDLMANLFVLITHHSLTQSVEALTLIIDKIDLLCEHSEIEHYPLQLKVLSKMRELWRTKLFDAEQTKVIH